MSSGSCLPGRLYLARSTLHSRSWQTLRQNGLSTTQSCLLLELSSPPTKLSSTTLRWRIQATTAQHYDDNPVCCSRTSCLMKEQTDDDGGRDHSGGAPFLDRLSGGMRSIDWFIPIQPTNRSHYRTAQRRLQVLHRPRAIFQPEHPAPPSQSADSLRIRVTIPEPGQCDGAFRQDHTCPLPHFPSSCLPQAKGLSLQLSCRTQLERGVLAPELMDTRSACSRLIHA